MRTTFAAIVAAWVFFGAAPAAAQDETPPAGGLEAEVPGDRLQADVPAGGGLEAEVPPVSLGGESIGLPALLSFAERHAPRLAVAKAEVELSDADFGVAAPVLPDNAMLRVGVGARVASQGGASDLNAMVLLLQPFEIAGQRPLRFEVARAARTTRTRHLEQARWEVHQLIHAGYRGALAARRRAELTRHLAAFAAQLVTIASERVRAGDAAPLIERLAEADEAQAEQRAVAALQDYRDACLALAEVAGWPASRPPEPIGELTPPRHAPALGELTELALAHNPELLQRRAASQEAALRVDLAHRDAWPDPRLGAQYVYEGAPGGGIPEHVLMGILQLDIPSFALNQAAIARTTAEREVADARRDVLASLLEVRLERLRSAVNAAAERVRSYGSDILPRFAENLTMLRRAFELGEIDLLRVSVALERFLSVQQQALGAHVDYFAAVAALEAEVGEEILGRRRRCTMNARDAFASLLLIMALCACGSEEGAHHEEAHEAPRPAGEVHLSPEAIAASGIEVGEVERRALTGGAGLPAELSFDPLSTAHVSPLASGRFTRVAVALGDTVEEGQLLGTVLSGDASEASSQLAQARARLSAAENALDRHRQLVGEGIGAQRALVEAEAEVAGLRAEVQGLANQLGVLGSARGGILRLEAPIAGVVVQMHATPGETASPDEPAFTIADPTKISAYGQVPELAISRVEEGLSTLFRPHAFPELALPGTIQYVAPAIDPETRTLSVRVSLDALDPRLRSGMFGTLEIIGDDARSLAVPTNAVVTLEGTPSVFVPGDEEGSFRPVPVRIGRRAGSYYELLDGLAEGDALVVAGAFTLKSAASADELTEHHD